GVVPVSSVTEPAPVPLRVRLVPEAAPMFGVVSVTDALIVGFGYDPLRSPPAGPDGAPPPPPPGRHSNRLLAATQVITYASLQVKGALIAFPCRLPASPAVTPIWAGATLAMKKMKP